MSKIKIKYLWISLFNLLIFSLVLILGIFLFSTLIFIFINGFSQVDSWGNSNNYINSIATILSEKWYIVIGLILLTFLILWPFINWWWLKEWWLTKTNKNKNISPWFYNENEGSLNLAKFKSKFADNKKPGWVLKYFKTKANDVSHYYVNNDSTHLAILGTTNSGKSQYMILNSIYYNCALVDENKPNMIITDPKGELLSLQGNRLINNGYDIKVLDLNDARYSIAWNPLYMAQKHIFNGTDAPDYYAAWNSILEAVDSLPWNAKDEKSIWVQQAKDLIFNIAKFILLFSLEEKSFLENFNFEKILYFLNAETFKKGKWNDVIIDLAEKNSHWYELYDFIVAQARTPDVTFGG
ncbi:type IV secretory system conjugative DNA transfer family protein, partial [Mycoplasmopsis agassizii]